MRIEKSMQPTRVTGFAIAKSLEEISVAETDPSSPIPRIGVVKQLPDPPPQVGEFE